MDKLGVAIVGLDHWYLAFDLAQQAAQGANTRLVAVADPSPERAEEVAKRYGTTALSDLRAAIDRPDVQIVAITASTDQAGDLIKQAAAAGKHILGVKPFALDMPSADQLVEAVTAAGVQYFPLESSWRLIPEPSARSAGLKRVGSASRYATPTR